MDSDGVWVLIRNEVLMIVLGLHPKYGKSVHFYQRLLWVFNHALWGANLLPSISDELPRPAGHSRAAC